VLVDDEELIEDDVELEVVNDADADDWLELDDDEDEVLGEDEDDDCEDDDVVPAAAVDVVVEVVVVTVAKYKPTPATIKITTMITTTMALETALILFFSDMGIR